MASGFFRPFGKKRQSRAANPDERDEREEEKIKKKPLRLGKRNKKHSKRIGKPEKVPRHSQKGGKNFNKIRVQFVVIRVKKYLNI